MRIVSIILAAATVALVAPLMARADEIKKTNAVVDNIDDARVPAQEEGMLLEVFAKDGQLVPKDFVLARIDETLVQLQRNVAEAELEVAKRQSEDTVSVDYATAAAKVYLRDYQRMTAADTKVHDAVSQADMDIARLKYEEARLQAIESNFKLGLAKLEVKVSQAKMTAADKHIARSKVLAPWDGVVERVVRFTGDWVKPGDPILVMIRMDKLRVRCEVDALKYRPQDVYGQPVQVQVTLSGGSVATFNGRVTGFSPRIDSQNNRFFAWTELENPKKKDGLWLLWPGMSATMIIQTK